MRLDYFDLSQPFGLFEVISTIIFVLLLIFIAYIILKIYFKRNKH